MRQRGFTLIEVLVTLAVSSVLLTGAVLSIQQIMVTTSRNNSQVVVLDEVNRAALQFKKDLQSRDSANISADSHAITINWIDNASFAPGSPQAYTASYGLSGTNLLRTGDNTTTIVARRINNISFSQNGVYINVAITATSSSFPYKSETISFSIDRRIPETE